MKISGVSMNDIILKNEVKIENLIYEIRGKQVMLDSDLARLYGCANGTKTINLAVKRHINRFPERFMFQLTIEEVNSISRFQVETLKGQGHNIKYLPYVFTEEVSIRIMDAFVLMRKYISTNLMEQKYINNMVLEHDTQIKLLQHSFNKLEDKKKTNEIYFDGQIYDAYSKILDIFKFAKSSLTIIDSYADNVILDMIKRLNISVLLITKSNGLLTNQDIERYNKQYHNLTIKYDNTFHDRYFILDNEVLYHCGASINRIGYKTFSINLIDDESIRNLLLDKINKI